MRIRLYGICKDLGYCAVSCGLCYRINAEVERKLAEPILIRPKRPRGRPPRTFREDGKQYFQTSISYYRAHEEVNVRVVQTGFMDKVEEL